MFPTHKHLYTYSHTNSNTHTSLTHTPLTPSYTFLHSLTHFHNLPHIIQIQISKFKLNTFPSQPNFTHLHFSPYTFKLTTLTLHPIKHMCLILTIYFKLNSSQPFILLHTSTPFISNQSISTLHSFPHMLLITTLLFKLINPNHRSTLSLQGKHIPLEYSILTQPWFTLLTMVSLHHQTLTQP